MSIWHWAAAGLLATIPLAILYFVVAAAARAGARAAMKDQEKGEPDGGN